MPKEKSIIIKLTGAPDDIESALTVIADLQESMTVNAYVMKKDGTEVHISDNEEEWLSKVGSMKNLVF